MIPMGISADYRGLIWFNGIIMGFQSDTTHQFHRTIGLISRYSWAYDRYYLPVSLNMAMGTPDKWISMGIQIEPLKIPWLIDCYRGLYYLVYWGL